MPRFTRSCERCNNSFRTNQSVNHVLCAVCRSQDRGRRRSAARTAANFPALDTICEGCGCGVTLSRGGVRPFCDSCKAVDDRWRKDRGRGYRFGFIAEFERAERKKLAASSKSPKQDSHIQAYKRWMLIKKKPWLADGLSPGEKHRVRCAHDEDYAIKTMLIARTRAHLKRKGIKGDAMKMVRQALKTDGRRGASSMEKTLGYSVDELRNHLEKQFTKGMSWDAFNNGGIHIDHIIPLSSFDLQDPNDAQFAWSLTNLRPLWAAENMRKGNRRELII